VKACRDLPGYELFQYKGDDGKPQVIDSADVNRYLREISGQDFTAKDFRPWAGTVLAARALAALDVSPSPTAANKNVVRAVEEVAKRLGNTKAVCRKCYIHPAILDAYIDGATVRTVQPRPARTLARASTLSPEEAAVARFIELRLKAA